MKVTRLLVAAAVALLVSGIFSTPALDRVENLSLDSLFWLRHIAWGPRHNPNDSNVVVIAIDEETYRTAPFRDVPKVMWTKQIGEVIDSVHTAGASIIGFDIIFPTSVEPFIRGYDRDFMLSLRRAAKKNKIVLAKVQHQVKSISPFPGHSFAVGHQRNIRSVNLYDDVDGVIRRVPLYFNVVSPQDTDSKEPSFSMELAARATGEPLRVDAENGDKFLGRYNIPGGRANALTINFDGGSSIPTFSLADIYACVEAGKTSFLDQHFAKRVVLFGVVLDVEDRKLTSKRFITAPDAHNMGERCVLPQPTDLYNTAFIRDSIPGVYIHAAAVNNLMRQEALRLLGPYWDGAITAIFSLLVAAITMSFMALPAGLTGLLVALMWVCVSALVFRSGVVLPLFDPLISGTLTFALLVAYRFAVSDKDKRRLRQAFVLYLAPSIVDRMLARGEVPKLGGESRELSVLFSDLENYTQISENLTPEELVEGLNVYFSEMTDIIESHGGIVDKYIGDAIVAVFGAPLTNLEHARLAVETALACQHRLAAMSGVFPSRGDTKLHARIGINTGKMLVGNIGSKHRFNYTVMGDAVNVAARLESANKFIGSSILISESTAKACMEAVILREVDLIRVVGRDTPISVYEPICTKKELNENIEQNISTFSKGLALYRAGNFEASENIFTGLSSGDPVANNLAARARQMANDPPQEEWQGINELQEK